MTKPPCAKIAKIGGQLCVPIPKTIAHSNGWIEGSVVYLHSAGALGLWLISDDQSELLIELGELAARLTTGAAEARASVDRAVESGKE